MNDLSADPQGRWGDALRRLVELHRRADSRLVAVFYGTLCLKVVVLGVLLAIHPDALLTSDTPTYVEPARSLMEGGGFATADGPEIARTPGYPLFLVPFLAIFGESYAPAVVVAQFLLVGATAGLVRAIVEHVRWSGDIGPSVASVAFVLVLIEPNLFLSEYTVGTEVVFTFLMTSAVYWLERFLENEAWRHLLLGVLSLTAGAYVRPIGLYLPYLLAAAGLIWYALRGRWRSVLVVALAAVLHAGLVGAWSLRNEARFGTMTFTTISHVNLYEYIAASVKARAEDRSWQETHREFRLQWDSWEGNEADRARLAADSAIQIIREHPLGTALVGLRGLATNVLDPGTGEVANMFGLREPGSGIIYKFVSMNPWRFFLYLVRNEKALVVSLGLGLGWLVFMWGTALTGGIATSLRPSHVLMLVFIAYLLIVAAGPQSMARFRVPATPFILVFSSAGTARALRRFGRVRDRLPLFRETE